MLERPGDYFIRHFRVTSTPSLVLHPQYCCCYPCSSMWSGSSCLNTSRFFVFLFAYFILSVGSAHGKMSTAVTLVLFIFVYFGINICVSVCLYVCVCVCVWLWLLVAVCVGVSVWLCVYVFVSLCVCLYLNWTLPIARGNMHRKPCFPSDSRKVCSIWWLLWGSLRRLVVLGETGYGMIAEG